MTDDITYKLEKLADRYKDGDREMLYEDYEMICNAWSEIEHLRNVIEDQSTTIRHLAIKMERMMK